MLMMARAIADCAGRVTLPHLRPSTYRAGGPHTPLLLAGGNPYLPQLVPDVNLYLPLPYRAGNCLSGSTGRRFWRSSKWSCGVCTCPLSPAVAMIAPAATFCPLRTATRSR